MKNLSHREEALETTPIEICNGPPKEDLTFQQQLVELQQEKLQLRKDLQEAVAKRKSAEATTEKWEIFRLSFYSCFRSTSFHWITIFRFRLERLVGVLRKKINGVSLESSIFDEKQSLVRPLASALEKNPFIIANNRQGQKSDILPFQKPKMLSFRTLPQETAEGTNLSGNENKENETGELGSGSESSMSALPHSSAETTSVTAQVTITGPVTDLWILPIYDTAALFPSNCPIQ